MSAEVATAEGHVAPAVPDAWAAIARLLGSRFVTVLLITVFAAQAAWVAVTARSSVYDEAGLHLPSIALLARGGPFLHQAPDDIWLGDLERSGSYLYWWVLSLVVRVAGLDPIDDMAVLRLVSVAIAAVGAAYVWRLGRALGLGPVGANVALLVVTANPLLVFISGTVNYDVGLHTLAWMFLYYTVRVLRSRTPRPGLYIAAVTTCGAASLTKYTFLALAPVLVVAILVHGARTRGWWRELRSYWRASPFVLVRRAVGVVLMAAVIALVLERYGLNLARYGTLVPSCDVVHTPALCDQFGPILRNRVYDAVHEPDTALTWSTATAYVTEQWVPLMLERATLIGVVPLGGSRATWVGTPVQLALTPWLAGALLVAAFARLVVRRRAVELVLAAGCLTYVGALFALNLSDWLRQDVAAGVATRYVLVLLPVVVVLATLAAADLGRALPARVRPPAAVVAGLGLAVLLVAARAGLLSFVTAVDATWLRVDPGTWRSRVTLFLHRLSGPADR
ncbi:glycosyltransferase family 39 protein [Cellulomonas sp. URHD0024]|uniref:glycosyltransferase family 39 protein n=1 Tax=Cellulomonas sp. URHD0024 TaxID=1302620 RepID=UPI00040A43CC|nr:glycosyltransferase family 39 protein [Cellulomonas sp. URHD0024]